MKKNLGLFIALIGLATFTYFFQEKRDIKKIEEKEAGQRLINPKQVGGLRKIEMPFVEIRKEGQEFYTHDGFLVDKEKFQKFLDALGYLQVKNHLKTEAFGQLQSFIPDEKSWIKFTFDRGEATFYLGNKVATSQHFYMLVKGRLGRDLYVIEDSASIVGAYQQHEEYRSSLKYERFKNLIHSQSSSFRDTKVFHDYEQVAAQMKSVKIENLRNKPYELDFHSQVTSPQCPNILRLRKSFFTRLPMAIASLRGHEIYKKEQRLSDQIASMELSFLALPTRKISLYTKYGSLSGFFVHFENSQFVQKLTQTDAQLFFRNVQDYWEIIPLLGVESSQFTMTFSNQSYGVKVLEKKDKFEVVKVGDYKKSPINTSFHKLFELLKKRSDFVRYSDKTWSKITPRWSLKFQDKEFHVILSKGELMFWDKAQELAFVYLIGTESPIGLSFESYFL